jgi:hypothetical protein
MSEFEFQGEKFRSDSAYHKLYKYSEGAGAYVYCTDLMGRTPRVAARDFLNAQDEYVEEEFDD